MKGVANSGLRRLLAYNKSLDCAAVQVGVSFRFYRAASRKSAPRQRGQAKILGIDDAGVTVKFQGQTFKVAQYSLRTKLNVQDAGGRSGTLPRGIRTPKVVCRRWRCARLHGGDRMFP